jgi:multicomponent Na+:H+ antiporter subunit C
MTTFGYAVAAWLFLIGVYGIVTSKHLVHLCLCLAVVQSSTYVLLSIIGFRLPPATAPVFYDIALGTPAVDPIVQALMLTDIVVEATVLALLLTLIVRINKTTGTVDPNAIDLMKG